MAKHKHLEPICLPKFNQTVNESNCYATGWGTTAFNGLFANVLQEVRLPIMNNTYCREATNDKVIKYKADLMLCAGYEEGGKSTCGGDSGGPLVCPTSNHIWVQYGITSFGFQCGLKGSPTDFTRVSHYVDWIENNIQN
jgi:secreted trypsin-like serine protease